jgi:ribosome-associated toxin RatA of RatAB toxin-antitoxin module
VKFTEKINIRKDAEEVFDFTQDYSRRLEWDRSLKKVHLEDGYISPDLGVKVFYKAKNGPAMLAEYVSYKRPKVSAVKMTEANLIFKTFTGSWNYRKLENHETELLFLYSFQLRFPFSLFSSLFSRIMRKGIRQSMLNLKRMIEQQL